MNIAMILLTFGSALFDTSSSCNDVSRTACQKLDTVIDVCSDVCFSHLCQRYCKACKVLECYQCQFIHTVDKCTHAEECPSDDDVCVQEKSLSSNFSIAYRLGCVDKKTCLQLYGTSCEIPGQCGDHRGFCCNDDLCNGQPIPGIKQEIDMERAQNAATNDSVCSDIDATSCSAFYSVNRTLCDDLCFQRACPQTCGFCVECASCRGVDRLENCFSTKMCNPTEKCYTVRGTRTLGCLDEVGCGRLFDRGDPLHAPEDGNCCNGNLCNVVKPQQAQWSNCVPSTTAHPYVTFTSVTVLPSPVVVPGNITLGFRAIVHHSFDNDTEFNVEFYKQLLGHWSKIPCLRNFGSWYIYADPCTFIRAFKSNDFCSSELEKYGFPCSCPFNPKEINVPLIDMTVVPSSSMIWLSTGRFRGKIEMIHNQTIVGCIEVELEFERPEDKHPGFLFK